MPDQFGLETPQEAIARVRGSFNKQREAFNRSTLASNKYALLGQSLGNIFGSTIRKTLDTRDARKSEAQRLVETTGMSVQEARKMAKESVPREFTAVRQAKQFKKAGEQARFTINEMAGAGYSAARAQAAGKTVMAAQLRRMGFEQEATNMTLDAQEQLQAEESRDRGVQLAKAALRSAEAEATFDEFKANTAGLQPINLMALTSERLKAEIENSDDPEEIMRLSKRLSHNEGMMARMQWVSLSDADLANMTASGHNKIQLDILDDEMLFKRLSELENTVLKHKGNFASTTLGQWGASTAAALEGFFGLPPDTYGADTLISDVKEISSNASLVSAAIRHALTGAAMSAQEAPLLKPFLAQPGDSPTEMIAKIRAVKKYTQLDIRTRTEFARMMKEDDYQSVPIVMTSILGALQSEARAEIKAEQTGDTAPYTLGSGNRVVDENVNNAIRTLEKYEEI